MRLHLDKYFTEFPLPSPPLFSNLYIMITEEFESLRDDTFTIIRLPNTRLRNDWDVSRLIDGDELEIVGKD